VIVPIVEVVAMEEVVVEVVRVGGCGGGCGGGCEGGWLWRRLLILILILQILY
jgi:hypothetical protein